MKTEDEIKLLIPTIHPALKHNGAYQEFTPVETEELEHTLRQAGLSIVPCKICGEHIEVNASIDDYVLCDSCDDGYDTNTEWWG